MRRGGSDGVPPYVSDHATAQITLESLFMIVRRAGFPASWMTVLAARLRFLPVQEYGLAR